MVNINFKFLYPLFFAVAPAVFLWGHNFGEVPLREALPVLTFLVILGVLGLTIFWFLFRDPEKTAIMTSVFIVPVLFFDDIYNLLFFNSFLQLRWRWALVVLGIILISVFYALRKTKKNLSFLNRFLSITTGVFVLISFFQIGWDYLPHYKNVVPDRVEVVTDGDAAELRDIYYIILDGYSSPTVIKEVMGFKKMDKFVNFLENRGFFVAKRSKSNYFSTALSLPSSLNMTFLKTADDHKKHRQMAEDHLLKDFFKSKGYRFLHFGDDAFTFYNRYADENVNLGVFSPYQRAVWEKTIFILAESFTRINHLRLAEIFGFLDQDLPEKRFRLKMDRLVEIPNTKDHPVFVFAHFLVPQGGGVCNPDRDLTSKNEDDFTKTAVEKYLVQVACLNKELEIVIDKLLKQSNPKPIIILQGDHGFAFGSHFTDNPHFLEELTLKPGQIDKLVIPGVVYSFPIFNSYYLPGGGDKLLYDSITPVNTFRVILNQYFGQNLELLDDTSYTIDPEDASRFIPLDPKF